MDLFLKIVAAVAMGMMAFFAWHAYKHWQKEAPKPKKGDWQAALLPLGFVVLLVILLVAMVR